MRDYAKISPSFWTGSTGKEIKRRGFEGVVVALYLMSSPHSNMLGLFYQPALYMAHETGLGIEGASKGLQDCIDCGFCEFDQHTEMVWIPEMAAYQICDALSSGDKRCKGIQKDYEALPNNPFLQAFFDRYRAAFHLTRPHAKAGEKPKAKEAPYQAPSKPHRSQEQEQEQEQEHSEANASGGKPPPGFAELPGLEADPPAPPPAEASAPLSAKDRLWLLGPALLGETPTARSLLGKLAKTYGDDVLAQVLAEATIEKPIEPKAWVTAACEAKAATRPRANGREPADLLGDPTPDWAISAGFRDRFTAENAGCTQHNAAKFRGGQRVRA